MRVAQIDSIWADEVGGRVFRVAGEHDVVAPATAPPRKNLSGPPGDDSLASGPVCILSLSQKRQTTKEAKGTKLKPDYRQRLAALM